MTYALLSSTLWITLGINVIVEQPHIHVVNAFSIVTSINRCRSSTSIKSNIVPSIDSRRSSNSRNVVVNTKNRIQITNVVSYNNNNDFRLFYINNENRGLEEEPEFLLQQQKEVQESTSQDVLVGPNLPVVPSSVSLLSSSSIQQNNN